MEWKFYYPPSWLYWHHPCKSGGADLQGYVFCYTWLEALAQLPRTPCWYPTKGEANYQRVPPFTTLLSVINAHLGWRLSSPLGCTHTRGGGGQECWLALLPTSSFSLIAARWVWRFRFLLGLPQNIGSGTAGCLLALTYICLFNLFDVKEDRSSASPWDPLTKEMKSVATSPACTNLLTFLTSGQA